MSDKPALSIIACVISLNRKWDSFVVPRLNIFEEKSPEIRSATDLQEALRTGGCVHFTEERLNYKHPDVARRIESVTDWMVGESGSGSCEEQQSRLKDWAAHASPSDLEKISIPGFKLAGFQFMRMVFGADTVKPDVHVINYVSEAIGRRVSDKASIKMLEDAAHQLGMSVRSIEQKLWRIGARNEDSERV